MKPLLKAASLAAAIMLAGVLCILAAQNFYWFIPVILVIVVFLSLTFTIWGIMGATKDDNNWL